MKRSVTLVFLALLSLVTTRKSFAQTTTYTATGTVQTYTVPSGVTSLTFNIKGGAGGGTNGFETYQSKGGCGGEVQGTLSVTAGQVLTIVVGGQGSGGSASATMALGGFGGGGSDSAFSPSLWPGAGGGGGTFIIDSVSGDTLAVAGGGGGGGGFIAGSDGGGAGGNTTGGSGASFDCGTGGGGGGGTATTGGSGSTCGGDAGSDGTHGQGGSYPSSGSFGAGGGGGGWYGGGAGAEGAGGGGGSSYYNSTYVTGAVLSAGANCSNGIAILTVPCTGPTGVSATISPSPACAGDTLTLTGSATGATTYYWTGPGGFTSTLESPTIPAATTAAGGSYIFTAYDASLCPTATTASVTVSISPLAPMVTPTIDSVCNGGSVMLTAITTPDTVNLFPVESWESGVPGTAGTSVDGWNYIGSTASDWIQELGSSTTNPSASSAEAGSYVAQFGSHTIATGGTASIVSPSFNLYGVSGAKLSFWVYRDVSAYNTAAYNAEAISVYVNTAASTAGATLLGKVPRRGGRVITGPLTGTSTTTTSGWYRYTVTIPTTYAGYSSGANYIVFLGTSKHGDNQYLDSVKLTGIENFTTVPTWSPTTYLYSDAALTTPYTGSATDTVYVNPTGISTTTVETYSDVVTSGTCSSSNTSTITINVDTASVSGTTTVCAGGSATITFTGTAGATVSYTINGGSTSTIVLSSAGTATVSTGTLSATATYSVTGVSSTSCSGTASGSAVVTVNPSSSAISGDSVLCAGSTSTLTCTPTGGTWSIGSGTTVASIGSSSGVLGGLTGGSATVSYTSTGGCVSTTTATVHALPSAYSMSPTSSSYCSGGAGVDITLSGSATGISYQLYNAGTSVGTAKAGTGSSLDFGDQTSSGTYTVVGTNTVTGCTNNMTGSTTISINPLPTVYSVTGGGTLCSGGSGYSIGLSGSTSGVSYRLYRGATAVGSSVSGTGSSITFGTYTTAGTYTVLATSSSSCTSDMSDSAVITVNPLPTATYSVTGGGSYCAGGTGVAIGLSGSASGISYQLYDGATAEGSAIAGTGSSISFGNQTTAGTYTVMGTNTVTGCEAAMTGSKVITVNPLPTLYSITGGGPYCAGGSGVLVGLSGADGATVSYKLYDSSGLISSHTGAGAAFNFGYEATGSTYFVVATNTTTTCTDTMSGVDTIIVNPLPTVYTVTGSAPSYCAGGAGIDVRLSNSATGIAYQLYKSGTATGSAVAGTGAALDYGYLTAAGDYKVIGINTVTGCVSAMADSANVVINPLPTVYNLIGGGAYCIGGTGVTVSLSGSQSGVNYTIMDSTGFDTTVAGTGSSVSLMLKPAGTYTALATNATTGCTSNMSGTDTIIINILVPDSVTLNTPTADSVCTASSVTFIATPYGGGTSPTYQWTVNGLPASSATDTFTYTPDSADVVTVTMTSTFPCGVPLHPQYTTTVTVLPYGTPSVFITAVPVYSVCEGSPVTLTPASVFPGYQPVYSWIVNGIVDGTGPTFTYVPVDADMVYAILNSNYQCSLADSVNSNTRVMHVTPLSIPTLDILARPALMLTEGQSDTLTAIATNTGTDPTYQWYINNSPAPGQTSATFIDNAVHSGDSISCQLTNSGTCAGITTYNWVILTAFPEQVQQIATTSIQLIPNPNKGAFTIKGYWANGGDDDATVEITDMAGRVLYTGTAKTSSGQINEHLTLGTNFASGAYIIRITRNNEVKAFQFIVEQ